MSTLHTTLERLARAVERVADRLELLVPNVPTPSPTAGADGPLGGPQQPPTRPATPELTSIAANLARLADHLAPVPPSIVGTRYVAERLGCTTVWVAEMVRKGEIPRSCILVGTGTGRPWKFSKGRIDEWIASR